MSDVIERDVNLPAVQVGATTLLQAIAAASANPAADMDKMERLFAMHQQMVKAEAETAFNAALARAQAVMPIVAHNAANQQTSSKYAKLAAINKAITPIYTAEGFSISFDTADSPKPDYLRTIAILSHSAGHSRTYHIDMPPDEVGAKGNVNKTKVHATGSTNSYGRRYLVCMIFNVTTEDDNDGNRDKHVMPDAARQGWLDTIELCETLGQAEELWKQIAQASTAAGDVAAHEELRAAMTAKRRKLKGPV
jgi:hypothetical protein